MSHQKLELFSILGVDFGFKTAGVGLRTRIEYWASAVLAISA